MTTYDEKLIREKRFEATLIKMDEFFTSGDFAIEARKQGVSLHDTARGYCGNFLHKHCDQNGSKRSWRKKPISGQYNLEVKWDNSNDLAAAIKLVKKSGYRIMKQVSEWKEI